MYLNVRCRCYKEINFQIIVLALFAAVSADPAVILSGSLLSPGLTSAALVAPAAAPVVAPVSQVASYAPVATYPSVATVASLAPLSQLLSDYRYSSSYTYQDYFPVVNSALSLPYSLPYAYAADWYYRN